MIVWDMKSRRAKMHNLLEILFEITTLLVLVAILYIIITEDNNRR
jgi:hypothetical protein